MMIPQNMDGTGASPLVMPLQSLLVTSQTSCPLGCNPDLSSAEGAHSVSAFAVAMNPV